MCLVLIEQVVTAPITPTDSSDTSIVRERYELGVHTINNANPYQGVTVTEGLLSLSHYRMFKPVAPHIKLLLSLILPHT